MTPPARRWVGLFLLCVLIAACAAVPSLMIRKSSAPRSLISASRPSKTIVLEPADIAAPKRSKDGTINHSFLTMHEQFLARGRAGTIGVLFLGDSITQGWSSTGADVWNKAFAAFHPANFGIAGDRTQNLLWRIDNGELDHIRPRVVVLLIGTNNTDYPWEDIARADEKIVREIREKLPQAKLLLLGIFPREFSPSDPIREKIRNVNRELARLEDGTSIRYLNIGDRFLKPNGTMSIELMPDFLHPGARGYQVWADAMRPLLEEMMK